MDVYEEKELAAMIYLVYAGNEGRLLRTPANRTIHTYCTYTRQAINKLIAA